MGAMICWLLVDRFLERMLRLAEQRLAGAHQSALTRALWEAHVAEDIARLGEWRWMWALVAR